MEREAITQLAQQIAGKIKTEHDLNDFSRLLKKITVEAALNADWNRIWDTRNTMNQQIRTAAMAIAAKI